MNLSDSKNLPLALFHKKINQSHIIIHPSEPTWVILNSFGWEITKLLTNNKSHAEIVKILKGKFDVPVNVLENDVNDFIASILKTGILQYNKENIDIKININSIFIHITNKCNLHCKHCYYPNEGLHVTSELQNSEIEKFIESFSQSGGKFVTLSGGEPLLRMDLLNKIISNNKNISFNVLTNGTLIDDEIAGIFKDHNVTVQISIDGSTEDMHDSIRGKGSFNAAIKGIETLVRFGMAEKLTISTTIMRSNISDLENIVHLAKHLGVSQVRFIPLRKEGRACRSWPGLKQSISSKSCEHFYEYVFQHAREDFPDMKISTAVCGFLLDKKAFNDNGHWCPIGSQLVIDTLGDVYPCVLCMNSNFKLGNIKVDPIDVLKRSAILVKLVKSIDDRKDTIEKCRICMWKNFCQSGCAGLALDSLRTIWKTDQLCSYRKKAYKKAFEMLIDGTSMSFTKDDPKCF